MSKPDWTKALPKPPEGYRLLEAWFTTFDQPDASFLVEHLLPSLLAANRLVSHELNERALFFGELGTVLKDYHGKLTVISSRPKIGRAVSQYPWLGRYVDHFMVGANSRAVQHSKLWALHWAGDDTEQLDLYVSSTNLTSSAFKDQMQAGWKVSLSLEGRPTANAKQSWGEFIPFLYALGASAGPTAKDRVNRLVQLLGKAKCPDGVTFVASMPGSKSRAAAALRKLAPSAIHIMTPTVGDWTKDTLAAWSKDTGVPLAKIRLKWPAAGHPWASNGGWTLTKTASKALLDNGGRLDEVTTDVRFCDEHATGDERWSHAKFYLLVVPRKKKRRLLVTSANWSMAAWGAGKNISPTNFELGVLFETDWKMLESIKGALSNPWFTERADASDAAHLHWAEVTWDGKRIELQARSVDAEKPISAIVYFKSGKVISVSLTAGKAALPWTDVVDTPFTAQFSQGSETLDLDVVDLRPLAAFSKTPLPEVDPALEAILRNAFLLQRYGGPVVDIETISDRGGPHRKRGESGGAENYAVQAWLDARAAFAVVDRWRKELGKAKSDRALRERIVIDGQDLCSFYKQSKEPGRVLAAEELSWRLKET